jgi:Family of unknown function (DUF5677)
VSSEESAPLPTGAPERLRLHACQRLLRWVAENAEDWTVGRELDAADLLLLTIFARSTRTYEAVVRWLGERGFGEQGMMLNRSLFEDMVDAHWVSQKPELAVERLQLHDLYSRLLRAETQRRFPEWFDGRRPPALKVTNEQRKEMRRLFGKHGSNSWTGVSSMDERLESVLGCWQTEEDRRQVQFWAAWVHKLMNEVLHPSAFSIGRLGAPTVNARQNFEWRFGSTTEWLTQALHAALWTYSQTVGLILDRYCTASQERLAELFGEAHRDFRRAAQWEKTGRLQVLEGDFAP